jgi:ferritin-like metal-binding protein YciE
VRDAGIIAAAQRVEHYEIAAYGCAVNFAQLLGRQDIVTLLEQTLSEEKAADEKLSRIAEQEVNSHAMTAPAVS